MQRRGLLLALAHLSLIAITGCIQNGQYEPSQNYSAARSDPMSLTDQAIVGTTLTTVDAKGHSLTLKIDAVEVDAQDPDQEIYLYTVLYQDAVTSQWRNLCQPDREGVAKAIPLSGQWNETGAHIDNQQITFSCTNSAPAKCVRLGYKPWKTANGESLRDYHQACTRMIRADYCGNGISHTQEGTLIDVYDRLGIQQSTSSNNMSFEAAWTPEGAILLNHTRYAHTLEQLQQECPEKQQTMLRKNHISIDSTDIFAFESKALIVNHSIAK